MFSMVGKNEEKMDESSNLKHVENAEQVIAYNAETNYARVMLISLHIVSLCIDEWMFKLSCKVEYF